MTREASLYDFDLMSPACPSRTVLRHVADRWTPLVVVALTDGPLRFTDLRRRVGGVTAKVLTQTLRSMERDGLVLREETPGVPPRVDYRLTALGASLTEPVAALRHWAEAHAAEVLAHREHHDERHTAAGPDPARNRTERL
ncbi:MULTISPECIES: helix-turn-helix domain-containing protein [unclassified Actinomyces]|uniref:winged helix-turn-helix transcriptional regulator n=1 Tax=unclassified Actinomyces TaxID=2609248 RepID=UPI00202FFD88|nr:MULTISPECIES: helix-turn-helix domain-containing protein [unclassified Actinomyces]